MNVSGTLRTGLMMVSSLAVTLWLAWFSAGFNLQRSCALQEWPHLSFCGNQARLPIADQVGVVRAQIDRNPGDSLAYMALAAFSQVPGALPEDQSQAAIQTASQLAPTDPMVKRLALAAAVQGKQWPQAVALLASLGQHRPDQQILTLFASMLAYAPNDRALAVALLAHARVDSGWLEPVLRYLPSAKVPVAVAMPLVHQALGLNQVSPELGQFLIRELKASGHWVDAQALWIRLWNRPMGLLFNGDFEQGFIAGGFDWELTPTQPSKAGALIQQPLMGTRGRVLQVDLTGRAISLPVLRQHLVLPAGDYVFSGEFMVNQLRSEQGLTWRFTCLATGKEIARTLALKHTGNQWQGINQALRVPADCGAAVALSLQPFAAYEAQTGMRGQIQFDRLALKSL